MTPTQAAQTQELITLADEESVQRILQSSVLGLWEVVNNLTRLRPTKRDRYRARSSDPRACRRITGSTRPFAISRPS